MYRFLRNSLAFLTGFALVVFASVVLAEPATEKTLVALEATVSQNSLISITIAVVVLIVLGFIAGQQR